MSIPYCHHINIRDSDFALLAFCFHPAYSVFVANWLMFFFIVDSSALYALHDPLYIKYRPGDSDNYSFKLECVALDMTAPVHGEQ